MASLRYPLLVLTLLSLIAISAGSISPSIGPLEYTGHLSYDYIEGEDAIIRIVFQFNEEIGQRLVVVNAPSPWSWSLGADTLSMTGGSLAPGSTLVIPVSFNRYVPPGDRPFTAVGTTSSGESNTALGVLAVTEMLLLHVLHIISVNQLYLIGLTGILLFTVVFLERRDSVPHIGDDLYDWSDDGDVIEDDTGLYSAIPIKDDQAARPDKPCIGNFVMNVRGCEPFPEPIYEYLVGEVLYYIWPGSKWRKAEGKAKDEMDKAKAWFEKYCIYLTFKPLRRSKKVERKMVRYYNKWYRQIEHLIKARATIQSDHINEFRWMMDALQRVALRKGKLLVVFIDEYITVWRPTLVSANALSRWRPNPNQDKKPVMGYQQIGINWIDSETPYILTHELIHALGKSAPGEPGKITWGHYQNCDKAMSQMYRQNPRRRYTRLSEDDCLGKTEYEEILQNKGGNVLKLFKIPGRKRA